MTATTPNHAEAAAATAPTDRPARRFHSRTNGLFATWSWAEPRLWVALILVALFAVLTAGVFREVDTFEQAFAVWDGIAVIITGLLGGLLGVLVTYSRVNDAKQREGELAVRNEQLTRGLIQAQAYGARVRESLHQFATLAASFAEQRRADPSKHLVAAAAGKISHESALHEEDVAEIDPYLQMLAMQARDIVTRLTTDAAPPPRPDPRTAAARR